MNINAYYKKSNILNLMMGLYLIASAIFMDIGQPQFWASIAAAIILPTLVLRMAKHEKSDFRAKRKEIFRKKPSLAYQALFLSAVLPLILGFAAYKWLSFSYNQAAFVFVGFSSLFGIANNFRLEPLHKDELGKVFD